MAKITFDATRLTMRLEKIPDRIDKGLEAMGVAVLTDAQKKIYNKGNGKWAPWSTNYKPKSIHQMLWDSGTLLRSLTVGDSNNIFDKRGLTLRVGSNVKYAAAQNFGFGPLPARPFLLIDKDVAKDAMAAFRAEAFRGTF